MSLKSEQLIVYQWLNDKLGLPVFAEAYKGAASLINEKPAGYISFVAHTGRELMTRLASTVTGVESDRVQYQQHVDKLQDIWHDEWRSREDLSGEMNETGHLIPFKVCQLITSLIEDHECGRLRSSEKDGLFFSTFLDYSDKDKVPINFLSEWKAAKEWFLGHAHFRVKSFRDGADSDLLRHFTCLEGYLYIAASSQFERLKALDEILEATNE